MDCPPLRLAAKRWIQQLQDAEATDDVMREIIELGCRYGKWSLVQDGRGPRKFKRNFFHFSLCWLSVFISSGLASCYTSYVAVDPRQPDAPPGESWMMVKCRDVPNTMAFEWTDVPCPTVTPDAGPTPGLQHRVTRTKRKANKRSK